jgi:GT2 family glycosyltransferase
MTAEGSLLSAGAPHAGGVEAGTACGVVVIGRNEGERLRRCFASLRGAAAVIVYVDSGSTDGSVDMARSQGVHVVPLDLRTPFTAARARNEGFDAMRMLDTRLTRVFFVDGDCEVQPDWLTQAHAFLDANERVAAVCGRRRERFPQASVYNRLCDLEWNTPIGETRSCGGDVLMRVDALTQAGGYRASLIAGEEPELCVRLRQAGWRIWRLDAEMTWHDAALTRMGQWWKRAKRGGHAFAEGAFLHGAPPERHGVAATRRAVLWGALLPLLALLLALLVHPAALLLLLAYPLQVARLALRYGVGTLLGWQRAFFMVLARFPEAAGVLQFHGNRLRQRRSALIEYK